MCNEVEHGVHANIASLAPEGAEEGRRAKGEHPPPLPGLRRLAVLYPAFHFVPYGAINFHCCRNSATMKLMITQVAEPMRSKVLAQV